MTFDLAESAILSVRATLCTITIEYNSYVSKEEKNNSLCQIFHQNPADCIYLYIYMAVEKIKVFSENLSITKKRLMWEIHSKLTQLYQRYFWFEIGAMS